MDRFVECIGTHELLYQTKPKTVVNWKKKERIHGEAGGGHLSGAGRIVTLVNTGVQECTSCIMLLIIRLMRDIALKRAFDALPSHSPPPAQILPLGV
jgi:hypothetical protein